MNPLGYAYPAGAEHDPRAPWNQPDECEACNGEGRCDCPTCDGDGCERCDGVRDVCADCNGTGIAKTAAQARAEWLEDQADASRKGE